MEMLKKTVESNSSWRIDVQEETRIILTEVPNILWRGKPFNPRDYCGPARLEIVLSASMEGNTLCSFSGQVEYYGEDVVASKPIASFNLELEMAQTTLKSTINIIGIMLERRNKEWSAQQRYEASQRKPTNRHIQPTVPDAIAVLTTASTANRSKKRPQAIAASLPQTAKAKSVQEATASGPIEITHEQLSIEQFVTQLERVAKLHRDGMLSDREFEQAKLRLLRATE